MSAPDPFEVFRAAPARAAILTDFDGTLAPIVPDPDAAAPVAGAYQVLAGLASRYGLVGVISGRPVAYLQSVLPAELVLSGLYGLEVLRRGVPEEHPEAGEWRPVVTDVVARAADGLPGVRIEPKGLSVTLHYRDAPGRQAEIEGWAACEAARSGLEMRAAKMSVELHPPVAADKGTVVEALARPFSAACFLGDDVGDLPAFRGLETLAAAGVATVRVGVRTSETPAELLDRADVVVDGPAGALALLRSLLG